MNTTTTPTNAKHTPGPWAWDTVQAIEETNEGKKKIVEYAEVHHDQDDGGRDYICRCWGLKKDREGIFDIPDDRAETNARLIAAAPAMLEALIRLCDSLAWEENRSGITYSGYESAKAAIRAATREE